MSGFITVQSIYNNPSTPKLNFGAVKLPDGSLKKDVISIIQNQYPTVGLTAINDFYDKNITPYLNSTVTNIKISQDKNELCLVFQDKSIKVISLQKLLADATVFPGSVLPSVSAEALKEVSALSESEEERYGKCGF